MNPSSSLIRLTGVLLCTFVVAGCRGETADDDAEGNELQEALSLTPDLVRGRELYGDCAACHQSTGWGVSDGQIPAIAGQHYEVLLKQMVDLRNHERHNDRMTNFMAFRSLGDAQDLADVAAYLAELPINPSPGLGPGTDLLRGEELYQSSCGHCHGVDGFGNDVLRVPRLQGQHYGYLVRQIDAFGAGERHNLDAGTIALLADLSPQEVSAVADFMSRLTEDAVLPGRPPDADTVPD